MARNQGFDPMHDLLEGVVQQVLKLILIEFVKKKKYFTIEKFNESITNFDYGSEEKRDKPSANFDILKLSSSGNKIKQTAAQTWLLLRIFPFIVDEFIPHNTPLMNLVNLLQRICYTSFSNATTNSMIEQLEKDVRELHEKFLNHFPNNNPINKLHHLTHYASNIRITTIPNGFNCMRFEALNKLPKGQMRNALNFQNVPYSLAKRLNLKQMTAIVDRKFSQRVDIISESTVLKHEMQHKELLTDYPDNVCCVNHVVVDGVHFRRNVVVKYVREETNCNEFARVHSIMYINDTFIFVAERLIKVCFDHQFHSHRVQPSTEYFLLNEDSVFKRKAYNIWTVPSTDDFFLVSQYYDEFK